MMAGNISKHPLGANYLIRSAMSDFPVLRIFSEKMLAVGTLQEICLKINSWQKWKSSAVVSGITPEISQKLCGI